MQDISPFVTHVAELVWLLAHEPDDQDGQKEALRRALMQVSAASQSLILNDIAGAVSSASVDGPPDESMRAVAELAMRMASHSVRSLSFDAAVPAREVLDVSRALAGDPVPGDEGAAFDEMVVGLFLTGVTAQIGASGFVRHATPGAMPAYRGPARTPSASVLAVGQPAPPPPPRTERATAAARSSSESQAMMQVQLMRMASSTEGVAELLARVDQAVTVPNARAVIDDVTRATEDLASSGRFEDLAYVLERLHAHHDRLHDGDTKRAFLMGIRRLERPALMHGIARLLPQRRDLRDLCASLLVRAAETGADVLIDNLISAEAAGERRAYLEVLRQCPSAVNSLLHLLSDDRWYVVRNAVALLGELGATGADSRLAELASHREPRVRRSVATALGKLGTSRALLALLQAMNDPSPDVRLQAVHAIGAARNSRAVPWLIEALDHEQDADVQGAILLALGRMPTEDGVARLVRAAEAGGMLIRKPSALRLRAIDALADAGTPSARRALDGLLNDRDRDVRAAVERAIGRQQSA